MRRCERLLNEWSAHVTGKHSVVEMYDQLVRKEVIKADSRQRAMAEACEPLLFAARAEAQRRQTKKTVSLPFFATTSHDGPSDNNARAGAVWGGSAFFASLSNASASLLSALFPSLRTRALDIMFPENVGIVEKRGLYLHGDVGIGKTMILDLFELCDVGLPKQRAHLHAFMTEVSDRLVSREQELRELRRAAAGHKAQKEALLAIRPIDLVVADVLAKTPVLCFDEFQTFDVAHAALLSAFFTAAFRRGLFLITTSNRPPEALCTISASFNQFLPRLREHCVVVEAGPIRDYRDRPLSEHCHEKVFLSPNNKATAKALLDRVEAGICARMPPPRAKGIASNGSVIAQEPPTWITEDTLWHHGRCFVIPYSCGGVAVFDFQDLCGSHRQELAPADYELLAKNYHTVVAYNVPQIGTANRNAAHQFIVLVDILYQFHVKLLFTAQVPWERLLDTTVPGIGQATIESTEEKVESDYYSEGEDDRSGYQADYSFRNEEETISFSRIRSRLSEMGCAPYLTKEHRAYLTADFDFSCLIADGDNSAAKGSNDT